MKTFNAKIVQLLKDSHPRTLAAWQIVKSTELSFETVRSNLNRMRDAGLVDRDLDVGLSGHTLYSWYWRGPFDEAR